MPPNQARPDREGRERQAPINNTGMDLLVGHFSCFDLIRSKFSVGFMSHVSVFRFRLTFPSEIYGPTIFAGFSGAVRSSGIGGAPIR
jgi:hypothetical protein